jgi:hypothetical protein
VAGQLLPEKASSTCPECGTEMVITRITPILVRRGIRGLLARVQDVRSYEKPQARARLIVQVYFRWLYADPLLFELRVRDATCSRDGKSNPEALTAAHRALAFGTRVCGRNRRNPAPTVELFSWGSGQYCTDSVGQRAQARARSRCHHKTSEPALVLSKETQRVPKRKDTTCMPPKRPPWAYWDYAPHAAGRLRSD